MDIQNKPDRATLKSYFVKNAVPTASNFADLVDGLINQKDDGIAKLPGEPLSLQADVSDTDLKKVINFYKNFAETKPSWTLSLNPRADLARPETAKPGWSVGDAAGNSRLFIDEATGNIGVGTVTPRAALEINGDLAVSGVIRGRTVESTSRMGQRMYPHDPIIYQDIFDAKDKGAIKKLGNPTYYNDTSYAVNPWFDRRLIAFGGNNEADGNGAQITVPAGYDTVWVRVLGDRWAAMKAYFLDGAKENLGLWAGGYRSLNGYCPDGSLSDGFNDPSHVIEGGSKLRVDLHQWVPIPVGRSGTLALVAKPNSNWNFWLSGLAFSRNPWAHAGQSAVSYHWKLNGGTGCKWNTHDWFNDVLAQIIPKNKYEFRVPVVPSGRDKLLYIVEHNNSWNGAGHTAVTVNGKRIERFLASYDNPFARHWNSKFYERYIAAHIPADLIGNERYVSVKFDMSKQNMAIYFREIGMHDLEVPFG